MSGMHGRKLLGAALALHVPKWPVLAEGAPPPVIEKMKLKLGDLHMLHVEGEQRDVLWLHHEHCALGVERLRLGVCEDVEQLYRLQGGVDLHYP